MKPEDQSARGRDNVKMWSRGNGFRDGVFETYWETCHSLDVCSVYPPVSAAMWAETCETQKCEDGMCSDMKGDPDSNVMDIKLTWNFVPSSTGSTLHCIWTTCRSIKMHIWFPNVPQTEARGGVHLPAVFQTLQVQGWGAWPEGWQLGIWPLPAEAFEDWGGQTPSLDKYHFWFKKEGESTKERCERCYRKGDLQRGGWVCFTVD